MLQEFLGQETNMNVRQGICTLVASLFLTGCGTSPKKSDKYKTVEVAPEYMYHIEKDAVKYVGKTFHLKRIDPVSKKDAEKRLGVYLIMDGYIKEKDTDNIITEKEAKKYSEEFTSDLQKELRKADKKEGNIDISGFR